MAATLEKAGFDFIGGKPNLNLSKTQIRDRIRQFVRAGEEYDIGVLYFAGHGAQINGDLYLMSVQTNIDRTFLAGSVDNSGVAIKHAIASLNNVAPEFSPLLILDTCRVETGKFAGIAAVIKPQNGGVVYTASAREAAQDGNPFCSLFCESLLKGKTVMSAVSEAKKGTQKSGKQTPRVDIDPTTPIAEFKIPGLAAPAPAPDPPQDEWFTSIKDARDLAEQINHPLMIFFDANWCPICRKLQNEILSKPKFAEFGADFVMLRLFSPRSGGAPENNKLLAEHFGVTGFPAVVICTPEFDLISKASGYASGSTFKKYASRLIPESEPHYGPQSVFVKWAKKIAEE